MDLKIERKRFVLTPQDVLDEAYIEEVLDLKEDGDYVLLKRKNNRLPERSFGLITEPTSKVEYNTQRMNINEGETK